MNTAELAGRILAAEEAGDMLAADGLGADPAPAICHYSAAHTREGVPAAEYVDMPAIRDRFPHGVPCCADCANFYRVMA